MRATPTVNPNLLHIPAEFENLCAALDYAAKGETGMNFYSARAELIDQMTFAELRDAAQDLAKRLLKAGLTPGDKVILLADTDRDFVTAFMACQYSALIPVPVAIPVVFGERQDYVTTLRGQIESSGASAMIAPDVLLPLAQEAAIGKVLKLVVGASDLLALETDDTNFAPSGVDDVAYLQYSSGSTRAPKGVQITHRQAIANLSHASKYGLQIGQEDRCTSWLPLYHDMGFVGFLLAPIANQMSVDYIATRDFARRPLTWLKLISENGGTLSFSPTFGYDLCCRYAGRSDAEGLDLSSWRAAGIGGDMIRPQILRQFNEAFAPYKFAPETFVPSFGMAEATLAVSFAPIDTGFKTHTIDRKALAENRVVDLPPSEDTAEAREFVLCGPVLPNHECEFRHGDGRVVQAGEVGRLFLRGPSIMEGYYGLEEETHDILSDDGWLDTGDQGFLHDGEIVLTGRAKDLILFNGRNIWPQDLEWAVEELPKLRRGDAAAFSIDDGSGERVVVLIQTRISADDKRDELQQAARGILKQTGLANADVHLVPPRSLPQTSSGKLSRSKAKQKFLEGGYAKEAEDAAESAGA